MTTLVATDLDQTLIYSRRAIERWGGGADLVAVERYDGAESSFVTAEAAAGLADLAERAVLVPTTTRTPEQLARVRLPGAPPTYAIAANGGVLLVDGSPDPAWSETVRRRLVDALPAETVLAHAESSCRPAWTKLVRTASDLFVYAVLDRDALPSGFVAAQQEWAGERGWRVSLQGRKLYWVPAALTKSAAVAEVACRTGAERILAAGDSLLDEDLLAAADAGIAARHGELVAADAVPAHVRVTEREGIEAGAEIVQWFAGEISRTRAHPA